MLLEKIKNMKTVVEEVNDLQEKVDQHQQFKEFYESLSQEIHKCTVYLDVQQGLQETFPTAFQHPNYLEIISKMKQLEETFEKEPKKGRVVTTFRNFDMYLTNLGEQWFTFAKAQSNEAINTLKSVSRIMGANPEIDSIIQSLNGLSNKWPVRKQSIDYFKHQCENAKLKLTKLQASPAVQGFLNKVSCNEATINDLNPEVIDWLKTNQLDRNLVIRFK
ncbi:hypothetical protein OKW24_001570 [Peribacillus simplex]|uniref:hypothetical protein n=1 Tax=Peribacillus simplex TaxID=1478 RepID=UPI0024E251A7|nr:hypothetical protein [Peribacillus simplex]MDF9759797.1 hypothetical protein [Peribacillus simplex]